MYVNFGWSGGSDALYDDRFLDPEDLPFSDHEEYEEEWNEEWPDD